MFVRVTHYKMKPESVPVMTEKLNELKPQIMALPGIHQFINTLNEDGSGCVVSVVESREISDANASAVAALWANFQDHLTAPPNAGGYDVIVNWSA
ncbi:hypothetical protein KX928_12920 [Roseobacter sp. YSTF-M11]|uniref:Antibiotic biosynthesis monooxygenase n=1 Tax=Roseobacter insulae TaxID=2859783 RepID=A0A9X1FX71_9RHOB|nr:hypothetical protein [Roseobacter insulae]MBW4708685.1 hypothetical protein [Roseobacter insulae]